MKKKGWKPWRNVSTACQLPEKRSRLEKEKQATESIYKSTTSNNITARNLHSTEYYIEDDVKNSHPTHHYTSTFNLNNTNNFYIEKESNSDQSEENIDIREDPISPEIFFNQTEDITERVQPRQIIPRLNAAWRKSFRAALRPETLLQDEPESHQLPDRAKPSAEIQQDNDHIGSQFTKSHNSFRIWNINANTILTHQDYSELHELCISLVEYGVAAVSFSEVNLDLLDLTTKEDITNIFKQHFTTAKVIFITTTIKAPTKYKPGGTILVIL